MPSVALTDPAVPSARAGGTEVRVPELRAAVERWLAADPDPVTREELRDLAERGCWSEVEGRFAGRLTFGTAGLRAELGAGPRRMNRLVVRQAAAGLAAYLRDRPTVPDAAPGGTASGRRLRLVVGHDARHRSADFAFDTAAVATAAGLDVRWFDRPVPTPLLAFAVRHLDADAGVMVTASHNPPTDNGFKVYLDDGAQIIPPDDARIASAIERVAATGGPPVSEPCPARSPMPVEDAYLEAVTSALLVPGARDVSIVYTPLCGVGAGVAERALRRAGFPPPALVPGQAEPDPDFPGLPFPNPEEPGVLDRAVDHARRVGADVVLANDPDADRLGVAVPATADPARPWRALSGNEIGALLADHLLRHSEGDDRLVVATVVSSRLVERMARAAGVHYATTLTGFKWVVRPALAHPEWRFLFGYEEALGFSVTSAVRDKDGIAAALVFAELVADLRRAGSSPLRRLAELAAHHGLHATGQWSVRFADPDQGQAQAAAIMSDLRARPPAHVAGRRVREVRDLLAGGDLPPTDALLWDLDDDTRLVFRPSGTEPKLKVYLEVVRPLSGGVGGYAAARRSARAALRELKAELAPRLAVAAAG
jgi:phosphomannomutase